MHDPENEYTIISERGVEKGVLEGDTLKVTSPYRHDDPAIWRTRDRILLMRTDAEGTGAKCRLVLCWCEDSRQYAIWWENMNDSIRVGYPATFQGDYFANTNFRGAVDQFLIRADRAGLIVRSMVEGS